jgi:hypothetical protein
MSHLKGCCHSKIGQAQEIQKAYQSERADGTQLRPIWGSGIEELEVSLYTLIIGLVFLTY